MKYISILVLACTVAYAQAPTGASLAAAPPPSCQSFMAAGATYGPSTSPKWAGWGAVATLLPGVKCDPTSSFQPMSYSQYVVNPVKVNGVWTLQSIASTGVALPYRKFGPISTYILGTIGGAITPTNAVPSNTSVKLGSTFGPLASVGIAKSGWTFVGAVQWVNSSKPSIWAGFGRNF